LGDLVAQVGLLLSKLINTPFPPTNTDAKTGAICQDHRI
ncbi:MAG: hypothetical protein ACJAVT_002505, partial [Yoonia sp.]